MESSNVMAYVGIGALLISALLTAIYMLTIVVRAFFPGKDFDYRKVEGTEDPNWMMLVPLTLFAIFTIGFGIYSAPLVEFLSKVAAGLM